MARLVFVAVFLAAAVCSCGGDAAEQELTVAQGGPISTDRTDPAATEVSSDAESLAFLAVSYGHSGWPNVELSLIRATYVLWAAARADWAYVRDIRVKVAAFGAVGQKPLLTAADVLVDSATLAGLADDYESAGWPHVSAALMRASLELNGHYYARADADP